MRSSCGASIVFLLLASCGTADRWSKRDCTSEKGVLEENVRFVGKCLEDVPTVKECHRRGIEVGVLTEGSRNDRFWGEVDDPSKPRGCIYVNGLVLFNQRRSSGKAIDCGTPNPRAICICKRTCLMQGAAEERNVAFWLSSPMSASCLKTSRQT